MMHEMSVRGSSTPASIEVAENGYSESVEPSFKFKPYEPAHYYARPNPSVSDYALYQQIHQGDARNDFPAVDIEAQCPQEKYAMVERERGNDYVEYERQLRDPKVYAAYAARYRGSEYRNARQYAETYAEIFAGRAAGPRAPDIPDVAGRAPTTQEEEPYQRIYARSRDALAGKEYPRGWLDIISGIGSGAFGVVLLAKSTNGNTRDPYCVAVKMLKENADESEARSFAAEARFMANLRHPNVVSFIGVCMAELPWLLVLEYCPFGDLRMFLRLCVHNYDQITVGYAEQCDIAAQVASGMEYLSSLGLVHRDLAARNCLVAEKTVIKVGDFGLSRAVSESSEIYQVRSNVMLPTRWMAIESLGRRIFSTASDVWSFGVLLWEIVTFGTLPPYRGLNRVEIYTLLRAGYRLHQPPSCPDGMYDLMLHCWNANPRERPTFAELSQRLRRMSNEALAPGEQLQDLSAALSTLSASLA